MIRKPLGRLDLLCLGVNAIVGSGIYAFPGLLAQMLGPASAVAFLTSGLASLVIAFCFAEAGSMFGQSGGPYVYTRAAFGRPLGYIVGWFCWIAAIVSWAAVARALVPYLGNLWVPLGEGRGGLAAVIILSLGLGALNYVGVKPGAYATNILTVAKLVPLLALMSAAPVFMKLRRLRPFAPHGWQALPTASFMAFFAFQGFEVVAVPAGDAEDPQRAVPWAVLSSLLGTIVLYALLQLAAVATTPALAGSMQPLAEMAAAIHPALARLVGLGGAVSMAGFCAGVALSAPRYLEVLALDGFLPRGLAARHPRFGTPHLSVTATAALAALATAAFDFERLLDLAVIAVAMQYLFTCAALPLLRRSRHAERATFRLSLGPIVPILAQVLVLVLVFGKLLQEAHGLGTILVIGAVLAAGLIATLLSRRSSATGPQ